MSNDCLNNITISHRSAMRVRYAKQKIDEEMKESEEWNDNSDGTSSCADFITHWGPPIELYEDLVSKGFAIKATYYESGLEVIGRFTTEGGDECFDWPDVPEDLDDAYGITESREEDIRESWESGEIFNQYDTLKEAIDALDKCDISYDTGIVFEYFYINDDPLSKRSGYEHLNDKKINKVWGSLKTLAVIVNEEYDERAPETEIETKFDDVSIKFFELLGKMEVA